MISFRQGTCSQEVLILEQTVERMQRGRRDIGSGKVSQPLRGGSQRHLL